MSKKGLGRGLNALIPEMPQQEPTESHYIQQIPINKIRPNPNQPRKIFSNEALEELAQSIEQHGIVQPIVVRAIDGGYELVAGERRLRAGKMTNLSEMPALVQDFSDKEVAEIALIENLQREDLNIMEEAEAYKTLIEDFSFSQEQLANRLGKSRSAVTNTIRLLNLCEYVKELVMQNKITAGQVRPLISLPSDEQIFVADEILEKGLNSRQVEQLCKKIKKLQQETKKSKTTANLDPHLKDAEEKMMQEMGVNVKIKGNDKKGRIEIKYYEQEDLNRILEIILNKG
ncbi:ParB/RepB/Spo0J family partition protein [Proteinivorax hydrogeniformans]|uniref:ParB/RepB/Spo0J family partition protein n=1 Tax=Proteinivorax hydrogeniformans TaxID=1826727 RepID=A0AAU8HT23_9FIRM